MKFTFSKVWDISQLVFVVLGAGHEQFQQSTLKLYGTRSEDTRVMNKTIVTIGSPIAIKLFRIYRVRKQYLPLSPQKFPPPPPPSKKMTQNDIKCHFESIFGEWKFFGRRRPIPLPHPVHFIFSAPPKITLDPIFQVVRPGDNAYILCSANGDPPMRIQWAKEGQPYLPNSGATEMQICSNPCQFSNTYW